jgi:hypothetical protein
LIAADKALDQTSDKPNSGFINFSFVSRLSEGKSVLQISTDGRSQQPIRGVGVCGCHMIASNVTLTVFTTEEPS